RQRTMCEAGGTGPVVSARARWSDPPPVRKCARGRGTRKAAPSGAHRQMRGTERVHSPAPLSPTPPSGEHEKRAGTAGAVPALSSPSELVEHAPVHSVDHPGREVRRQGVVVALVEGEVAELVVLDDVLVEEAVQRAPFGGGKSLQLALCIRCKSGD